MNDEVRAIYETLLILMVSLSFALFLSMLNDMRLYNKRQADRRRKEGQK